MPVQTHVQISSAQVQLLHRMFQRLGWSEERGLGYLRLRFNRPEIKSPYDLDSLEAGNAIQHLRILKLERTGR